MKISTAYNQISKNSFQSQSNEINTLNRAKERLVNQIQKINEDKFMDEKRKQEKIAQLENQIKEIEKQIQKCKLEQSAEKNKENSKTPNESSENPMQTSKEREKEYDISFNRSIISADINKENLVSLGRVRDRLAREDNGISERVKRAESIMSGNTKEIHNSVVKGQYALKQLNKNNKETIKEKDDEDNNKTYKQKIHKDDETSTIEYII